MSNEVQLGSVPENSEQAVFDHLTSVTFDNSLDSFG